MALRLPLATAAQVYGCAIFLVGIVVTLYGYAVVPAEAAQQGQLLQTTNTGNTGSVESPTPVNFIGLVIFGQSVLMGASIAWPVGAFGVAFQVWRRVRLLILLAASAALGAMGAALVLAWQSLCRGTQCVPTGIRDAGFGMILSCIGLLGIAYGAWATSARSIPHPAP